MLLKPKGHPQRGWTFPTGTLTGPDPLQPQMGSLGPTQGRVRLGPQDLKSWPPGHEPPRSTPWLTQAGSLHIVRLALPCPPGPPASLESCSVSGAGTAESPRKLKRCLGGRTYIMCPALVPAGGKE